MLRRTAISLFLLVLASAAAQAQLEHATWYFGSFAGIQFRGGAPVAVTDGRDYQWEGTATMSDARTGNLLFHTDGDTVWNRNWQVMPNGTGLGGHISSTQSALILPMPGDSNRYYLITADAGEYFEVGSGNLGVRWAIVDMTADGGLGAVTSRDNVLVAPATEKIAAVPNCNGRGYWLVVHELRSASFRVYDITERGIASPRVQAIGTPHTGSPKAAVGGMKFTPDGRRLAVALSHLGMVELFDFDRATGRLSNPLTLSIRDTVYDVCFSPDGSRLYVTGDDARYLAQLDLTRGSRAAIEASQTDLFRSTQSASTREHVGQIQIGLDDRLYVSIKHEYALSVVTRPNAVGTAAGYQHLALSLAGREAFQGLPNFVYRVRDTTLHTCKPPRARFSSSDTSFCAGTTITFRDLSTDSARTWSWEFPGGDPASFEGPVPPPVRFDRPGTFRALLVTTNPFGADTFGLDIIVNPLPTVDAGDDRIICTNASVMLEPTISGGATFLWSPADGLSCTDCRSPIASPISTTTYRLVVTSDSGCVATDTVRVVVEPFPAVDAGPDQTICFGDTVRLLGRGGSDFTWSPAVGLSCIDCATPLASPRQSTTYYLTGRNNGRCPALDSVRVTVLDRPVADAGEGGRICRGDTLQLRATGVGQYAWAPSAGLSCTDCATPRAAPDATTTYRLTVTNAVGCASSDSVVVEVNPAPRVVRLNLGPDTRVYPGREIRVPVVLENDPDLAAVDQFDLRIDYLPTMLHLTSSSTAGTLLANWTEIPLTGNQTTGTWSARYIAPGAARLSGVGTILWLTFSTFIGTADGTAIYATLTPASAPCTRIIATPTAAYLDSVCGLPVRMISALETTVLERPSPSPTSGLTDLHYVIGSEGTTSIDIVDPSGRIVAVLARGVLPTGRGSVQWDASDAPAGLYHCRLINGSRVLTVPIVVRR